MAANTVLAIENDRQTAGLLKDALENAGYSVHTSENAGDGFSKARELVPSIIFLNLAAPGANGLEICKTIHSDEALKDVPLVLLTLREGKFDPIYTKLYGIVMFIKKPFTAEHILSCVREFAPLAQAAGQTEEVFVSLDDAKTEFEAEVVEAAEDDSPVYTLEDPGESLEEIGQEFQAPGGVALEEAAPEEASTVEDTSSLDVQDFKDSLAKFEKEEDSGPSGPAEFSMESFKEPLAEDAGPEEAGGPMEFDEESLTSPFGSHDSVEVPESEGSAVLEDLEGPSEMALESFTELTDDDIEALAGEDAPGESLLGLEEDPGESMEEPVLAGVQEEQPEEDVAAVQPDTSGKKGASLSARRARKGGGFFRKLVLTALLISLVGVAGYAGWYFFLAEEPPALAEIKLPYFDIKLSDIKLPKLPDLAKIKDKIKLPRFAQDLIDKAFPPEPEKAGPSSARPSPPLARAEEPKPAPPEPVKARPKAAKKPKPETAVEKTEPARRTARKSAPEPSVSRVDKKAVGPFYYVQFGAFKSPSNADKFQSKLKRNGLDVFMKTTRVDNATFNLVLLRETFGSYERALKESEAIKSRFSVDTAVYKD